MKSKIYKIIKDSKLVTKEIYIKRSNLPKTRNNSTFNIKKILKDRELKFENTLTDIVFSSGFVNSVKEAKHIILNNHIELNNKVINEPNTKVKSGDIITCKYNKTLLNYYNRRWNCIKFNNGYIKYKYLIPNKRIHRLSFNSVLWL